MQQRHLNRKNYFNELANTSREFYISYLGKYLSIKPGLKVLEIGCGEGGNLLPFAERNCAVTGIDRAKSRIEQAKEFFGEAQQKGTFITTDFLQMEAGGEKDKFDIILIHDVIEHVYNKREFVEHISQFATNQTFIFWGFPAWQMPFGGHQQICRHKILSHMPFIHLLPAAMYRSLLNRCGLNEKELLEIKECRMTIEAFEELLKEQHHIVADRVLWFINPHYKQKFKLKPRKLYSWIANRRYIRNFFSTSCFYLTNIHSQNG